MTLDARYMTSGDGVRITAGNATLKNLEIKNVKFIDNEVYQYWGEGVLLGRVTGTGSLVRGNVAWDNRWNDYLIHQKYDANGDPLLVDIVDGGGNVGNQRWQDW